MNNYTNPEIIIEKFELDNILTTSGVVTNQDITSQNLEKLGVNSNNVATYVFSDLIEE